MMVPSGSVFRVKPVTFSGPDCETNIVFQVSYLVPYDFCSNIQINLLRRLNRVVGFDTFESLRMVSNFYCSWMGRSLLLQAPVNGNQVSYSGSISLSFKGLPSVVKELLMGKARFGGMTRQMNQNRKLRLPGIRHMATRIQ